MSEPISLYARLRRLAADLPSGAQVTLTRADLARLTGLEQEEEAVPAVPIKDLTVEDISAELGGVPLSTVRGWMPDIPGAYKHGRAWRVPRIAFRTWLDNKARPPATAQAPETRENTGSVDLSSWRTRVERGR
jgi:hypothetical protein